MIIKMIQKSSRKHSSEIMSCPFFLYKGNLNLKGRLYCSKERKKKVDFALLFKNLLMMSTLHEPK